MEIRHRIILCWGFLIFSSKSLHLIQGKITSSDLDIIDIGYVPSDIWDYYVNYTSSSRMQPKSSWSSLGPSQLDSSLLNNIQKLFSERIDLSGPVEHNKTSVVTAIIKICLKVGNRKTKSFI